MKDQKVSEKRHLVASIVSAPNLPFIQAMYEDTARKAIKHMWGNDEFPKTMVVIMMVEGMGGPVESPITIVRCSLAQVEELVAVYHKENGKRSTSKESSKSAILISVGSPMFCQTTVRFWAAEGDALSPWGKRMINKIKDAPPCTFVWMDGKDGKVRKTNIVDLADIEDASA